MAGGRHLSELRRIALERLAGGARVSGSELAVELGVSRAAIARHMARLRAEGWPISARRGEGYRLAGPARPLRAAVCQAGFAGVADRVAAFELIDQVDSTSTRLRERDLPADGAALVCIAERQSAGRGRRGGIWLAPVGSAITLSLARRFDQAPPELGVLGLVAGVAVAETLAASGAEGVRLKWPNDLVAGDAKLGGILVEISGEAGGPTRAVVGVGINHDFAGRRPASLDDLATDLTSRTPILPGRDEIAGRLIAALVEAFDRLASDGFESFRARWAALDALAGRPVRVHTPRGSVDACACGIDIDGALLVDGDGGRQRFLSADVSVRPRR